MYYLLFIVGVILLFIDKNNKKILKLYIFLLMILSYFRYGVGVDYFGYEYLYERIDLNITNVIYKNLDNQEIGYKLLQYIFKLNNIHFQILISFISTINLIFIYKIIIKYSKNYMLSILVYYSFFYFIWTFSAIRQGLVIPVVIYYLLEALEERKIKTIIISSIILSGFHLSALIAIPVYIIMNINIKKKLLITIFFMSVIISLLPSSLFNSIAKFIPFYSRFVHYIENTSNIINIDFQSFVRILFTIYIFYNYDKYIKKLDNQKLLIDIFIIFMSIYFILKSSELTAARISIYGFILLMIILPNIIEIKSMKTNKRILTILLINFSLIYMQKNLIDMRDSLFNTQKNIIVPYTSIFNIEKVKFNNRYYEYLRFRGRN